MTPTLTVALLAVSFAPAPFPKTESSSKDKPFPVGSWVTVTPNSRNEVRFYPGGRYWERWGDQTYVGTWRHHPTMDQVEVDCVGEASGLPVYRCIYRHDKYLLNLEGYDIGPFFRRGRYKK